MSWPKLLIAFLCFSVCSLVFLAAPAKRLAATVVLGIPFFVLGVAALGSARREHVHQRRFAQFRSERSIAALIGDPGAFVRQAPSLAAEFRAWAGKGAPRHVKSQSDLEQLALSVGNSLALESDRFPSWVAVVGEVRRLQTNGRWSVARLFHRGEPVVVSRRFPYVRVRPLPEAIELLEVSSTLEHV